MTFKPGNPKPPGSGMTKGKKTKKTIARETAHANVMTQVKKLAPQFQDMTAPEVAAALEFNPLAYLIKMLEEPGLDWPTRFKAVEAIQKVIYPAVKAVEVTGETTSEIRITIGGGDGFGQTIEGQPSNRLSDARQDAVDVSWQDDRQDEPEAVQQRSTGLSDGPATP